MITVDTSGVLALFDRLDRHHPVVAAAYDEEPGPAFLPVGILGELCYMLEDRYGTSGLLDFLEDLESAAWKLDCGEHDIGRVRQLVRRYGDLPLGYADAAVIACAERRGGRVLTTDRRDFDVVAREGRLTLVP